MLKMQDKILTSKFIKIIPALARVHDVAKSFDPQEFLRVLAQIDPLAKVKYHGKTKRLGTYVEKSKRRVGLYTNLAEWNTLARISFNSAVELTNGTEIEITANNNVLFAHKEFRYTIGGKTLVVNHQDNYHPQFCPVAKLTSGFYILKNNKIVEGFSSHFFETYIERKERRDTPEAVILAANKGGNLYADYADRFYFCQDSNEAYGLIINIDGMFFKRHNQLNEFAMANAGSAQYGKVAESFREPPENLELTLYADGKLHKKIVDISNIKCYSLTDSHDILNFETFQNTYKYTQEAIKDMYSELSVPMQKAPVLPDLLPSSIPIQFIDRRRVSSLTLRDPF